MYYYVHSGVVYLCYVHEDGSLELIEQFDDFKLKSFGWVLEIK